MTKATTTIRLSEVEGNIIRVRYGLGGHKDTWSRSYTAKHYKTTPDGIRNIERRALDKLEAMFVAAEG